MGILGNMGMPLREIQPPYRREMRIFLLLVSFGALLFVGAKIVLVFSPSIATNQSNTGVFFGKEEDRAPVLPSPDIPQKKNFTWKYQGKTYVLDATFHALFYEFYATLPTGVSLANGESRDIAWWTKLNTLFLSPVPGDTTLTNIAMAIRKLGEENGLDENQIVELVAAFVQSISYDQTKTNSREAGLGGQDEKTTYPYEVLYSQKGVCQDKSYLAYRLLQELGVGVSIFLFPDPRDNHMAVGVRCPSKYANYNSEYCFLETTGTGNKIGTVPSLVSESRVATAQIRIGDVLHDQSENEYQALGRVEILNAISGKEYTGIIETLRTHDELTQLKETIYAYKRELKERGIVIADEEKTLDRYNAQLAKLKKQEKYEEYNALIKPYNDLIAKLEQHASSYNDLVKKSNQAILRYNKESKLFYE